MIKFLEMVEPHMQAIEIGVGLAGVAIVMIAIILTNKNV